MIVQVIFGNQSWIAMDESTVQIVASGEGFESAAEYRSRVGADSFIAIPENQQMIFLKALLAEEEKTEIAQ